MGGVHGEAGKRGRVRFFCEQRVGCIGGIDLETRFIDE
jgi:hypothetical protein